MRMKLVYIACLAAVLVLGCAKPPLAEMESAREAVFRAENDANAALYAAGSLARARDALRRMNEEADSKRYDAARMHAAEAITAAEKAIVDGRSGAGRAGDESASIISSLRPEIEETTRNVNGARYSQMALDYDALDRELTNAHADADRAEAGQAEGRYQEAADIARGVRSDLLSINQRVASAVSARKK
jgi:hypothetical protein